MPTDRQTLTEALISANRARKSSAPSAHKHMQNALRALSIPHHDYDQRQLRKLLEEALSHPSKRLAVYGSLAPGKPNHHVVADLPGSWFAGTVEGTLHESGWGATMGYPGMLWRPGGRRINVEVLESPKLPNHWARLDAFEGEAYVRVLVPVDLATGACVVANIYEIRDPAPV